MRVLNRILGLLVAMVGFGLAGWAPPAFELLSGHSLPIPVLSGHSLPIPVATDPAAMTAWSGVAFVRVFGAVLFGIGATLWASNARTPRPRVLHAILFVSFVFAGLIVWAQQVAIWGNTVGWALVALFGALAISTGVALAWSGNRTSDPR
jgi:hypothetical protein